MNSLISSWISSASETMCFNHRIDIRFLLSDFFIVFFSTMGNFFITIFSISSIESENILSTAAIFFSSWVTKFSVDGEFSVSGCSVGWGDPFIMDNGSGDKSDRLSGDFWSWMGGCGCSESLRSCSKGLVRKGEGEEFAFSWFLLRSSADALRRARLLSSALTIAVMSRRGVRGYQDGRGLFLGRVRRRLELELSGGIFSLLEGGRYRWCTWVLLGIV